MPKSQKKALNKSDILNAMAEHLELPRKKVREFFEVQAQFAYQEAKNGFTIPDIGKLVLVHTKERDGRNPATGEKIRIPAKTKLKFRIAKRAKEAVQNQ